MTPHEKQILAMADEIRTKRKPAQVKPKRKEKGKTVAEWKAHFIDVILNKKAA